MLMMSSGRPRTLVQVTGPATWLTTLSDWDAFADWYTKLIEGRSSLHPELAKQVDAWTEGKDSKEVVSILFDKVANEVRYTGLEFGVSALQPLSMQRGLGKPLRGLQGQIQPVVRDARA